MNVKFVNTWINNIYCIIFKFIFVFKCFLPFFFLVSDMDLYSQNISNRRKYTHERVMLWFKVQIYVQLDRLELRSLKILNQIIMTIKTYA